ncbi:MAG: DUF4255 domain-containing protein [bacterium]
MALVDISLVTNALISLINAKIDESELYSDADIKPKVTSQPPDKLKEDNLGKCLGIYLYHISEDPHYKNLPPPGADAPPVRYSPIALNLFYQLTAYSKTESSQGTYDEQKMLGIAIKALHDYPVIDETTKVNNTEIFPPDPKHKGNLLRITLQPIEPRDAVSYWTAGSSPMRLALYYQVSVVFLEPEESQTRSGKVLRYGVFSFPGGSPRIDGCSNILTFKLPGTTKMHEIELKPAQVPVGQDVFFKGSGFTGGTATLWLKNNKWEKSYAVDNLWNLTFSGKGAMITVVEKIIDETGNIIPIFPGIYTAAVKVTKQITIPDGSVRELEHLSNECPFTVSSMIYGTVDNLIGFPAGADKTITVEGYAFPAEEVLEPLFPALNVYVGTFRLKGIKSTQALTAGDFKVEKNSGGMNVIRLLMPAETDADHTTTFFPLRVFVNGAESPPNWIQK